MDRLSELPESLIHHILSFLPMEDVVRTNILSKRWKDLWTTVPCLQFRSLSDELDKFRDFVNRTLMLFRGSKVQKFSFSSFLWSLSLSRDRNLWVRFAVEHGVEELELSQSQCFGQEPQCLLPQCLFSSSSIRKLQLHGFDIVFHGNICWDRLKSLRILHKRVDQFVIDNVLLGSPQLEILEVCCDQCVNICSTTLKELCIEYDEVDYYSTTADEMGSVSHIQTPNLEVLKILGSVCKKRLFLGVPRLIKATLNLRYRTYNFDESDYKMHANMLRIIFRCINHVQELMVGDWCIQVLTMMTPAKRTDLPSPLLNLKCLTVDTLFGKDCLAGFVNLLEIAPNVGKLTIENSYFYKELLDELPHFKKYLIPEVELSDSFLKNLKILQVEFFIDSRSLFSLSKFILKSASALEKIVMRVCETGEADVLVGEIQKRLKMPRLSPNAEVVLHKWCLEEESRRAF